MASAKEPKAQPRNIVPLIAPHELAAFAPAPTAQLIYHGGPLLSTVQVTAVFWGDAWQHAPNNGLIAQLGGFFDFILQSSLMDVLAEYSVPGHPIERGQYLGPVTLAAPALGSFVSDTQIQQALQQTLLCISSAGSSLHLERRKFLFSVLRLPQPHQ